MPGTALKFLFFVLITTSLGCKKTNLNEHLWNYPSIEKKDIKEEYFGRTINDPYRHVEKLDDPQVKNWVSQQNNFYRNLISTIPNVDSLNKEITHLYNLSSYRIDVPRASSKRIFFKKRYLNSNNQDLFYKDGPDKESIKIFSVNQNNEDLNIDYFEPSYDGKLLAMGISKGGDEISTIYVLDVAKKQILKDSIENAMFGNPQWLPDNSGFFYNQLKIEVNSGNESATFEDSKVKLHILGSDVKMDKVVFARRINFPLSKIDIPVLYSHPSSDNLLVVVYSGSDPFVSIFSAPLNEVVRHEIKNTRWNKIISQDDKVKSFAFSEDRLFTVSQKLNPDGTLEVISLNDINDKKIIFGKAKTVLEDILLSKSGLYLKTLNNGFHSLYEIDEKNYSVSKKELPFPGAIEIKPAYSIPSIYLHHEGLFLLIGSWNVDWQIYYLDPKKNNFINTKLRPENFSAISEIDFKEVEVESFDGAKVPLSIIFNKEKVKDISPTILYGYGAYGTNISPFFDPTLLSWLDRGGIYAVAHVRGGGEKGHEWYMGGYKKTKSNSWKDFIACAEYLIEEKYTSPEKLAAEGESAGGITVGRAIIERPDLFKAAIISSGALNPLRDESTENTLSAVEFGSVKDSLEFQYLFDTDVYHNIKKNVNYPSMLLSVGINDNRVAPWQSAKVAAKLQRYNTEALVLLKVSEEGHESIGPETEKYAFLLWQLGVEGFRK